MVQCPYDKLSLQIALLSASSKLEKIDSMGKQEFEKRLAESTDQVTGGNQNENAAKFHGLTVEALVNSPNYKILKEEWEAHQASKFMAKLRELFGFTEKEAWAVFAQTLGSLDD